MPDTTTGTVRTRPCSRNLRSASPAVPFSAVVRARQQCECALRNRGQAALIGHDWCAEAAYAAGAYAPDRWRRLVTLAVPPAALDPVLWGDYDQLRRIFYLFMFRDPAEVAEAIVTANGMAFLDRLWADWSPGHQPGEHLAQVMKSLRRPANLAAATSWPGSPADPAHAYRGRPPQKHDLILVLTLEKLV